MNACPRRRNGKPQIDCYLLAQGSTQQQGSLQNKYINSAFLIHEFFQGFINHANVTLHVDCLRGENSHHQVETVFKAFGRALRMALEPDPRMAGVMPSTKGSL